MKGKKLSAIVNFTIHSLRLPEEIQDTFQIEFKRGNTIGITDQKLANAENEVPFEKTFRCNVTLVKSDDEDYKKKKIAFTVYRYRNSTKKVYGKFTINASDYLKQKTDTIEIESPHSKKAYIIMTVGVTTGGVLANQNDLDSQSEAIQLQTDHIDEWDVSDMVTPESRERIQNFFMKREAEKNEQRSRLSDFARVAQQKEARNSRNRYQRRGSLDLLQIQASLPTTIADAAEQAESEIKIASSGSRSPRQLMSHSPSFNQNFIESSTETKLSKINESKESKEPVKLDNFLAKKNKKRGIPLPAINNNIGSAEKQHVHHHRKARRTRSPNLGSSPKQASSSSDVNNDDYDNDAPQEAAIDPLALLQNVLSKKWDKSPVNLSKFPNSASAVVSCLAHTHFLASNSNREEEMSNISKFVQLYKSSTLLTSLNDAVFKWFVTSFIAATVLKLKDQFNFDTKFVTYFNTELSGLLVDQLYAALNASFSSFQQVGRSLIHGSSDNNSNFSQILNDSVDSFKSSLDTKKLAQPIVEFLTSMMIKYFDRFLVESLISSPDVCTFQNAVQWNTTITILYDQEIYRSNMNLFREAVAVLMMSSVLCGNPKLKDEVCPNIPPAVVYKILSIQKVDDFLQASNDTKNFREYYKIDPSASEQTLDLKESGISLDIVYSDAFDTSQWKNASFSDEQLQEFPFLKEYFNAQ